MNTKELSEKILNGETLTPEEREVAARIVRFGQGMTAALDMSRQMNGVVTLSSYGEGQSSDQGDTPLSFLMACDTPHPDTWAAIQAATDPDGRLPVPADVQEKADLWDAFLGAGRLRMLGWAGSEDDKEIRHFGAEFWVSYPGYDFTVDNARARELITAFARTAADAQPAACYNCGTVAPLVLTDEGERICEDCVDAALDDEEDAGEQ